MLCSTYRIIRVLTVGLIAWLGTLGCSSSTPQPPPPLLTKGKPKPSTRPVDAWSNARNFCALPLSKAEIPPTGDQLGRSIVDAWRTTSLKFKDPRSVVTILGGRYPAIGDMRVDLTNSELNGSNKKSRQLTEPKPTTKGILVDRFALIAEPSIAHQAKINMLVTGTKMRFDLQADKDGRPVLVMGDADTGFVHFDMSVADIEKIMIAVAREDATKRAIFIRSIELKLTTFGPRSLDVVMTVRTLIGFAPAGMTFTARVDIDDKMNAKLSNLSVNGDELFGPLITQFIRPSLVKYEGKTKPLIAFPNEQLKLKDVRLGGGERFTMDAAFGK